jgi:predicted Zn-dependent peptidase
VLNQTIKEQKQLAFSVYASNSGAKDDGIFYVGANFEPSKQEKLETTIFAEISKIKTQGVTPAQLNLAKNVIERDTYYSRESITNIATEIGYTMVTAGDIKFYENYLSNIKKVTAADVKRAANKYLSKEKSAVSIVLPDDAENSKGLNIEQNINRSTAKPFNPPTIITTPNDTNDIIAVSIYAKGGQLTEKIPGTANLAASVMMKGTENYSSIELAQILEDNGIKVSPGVSVDAFTINVLTTKKEYTKTLEILDEIVNHAVFADEEIAKVKTEKLNLIKKNRDVPFNIAIEEYKNLIYGNSPYSTSTKILEKTLPTISREDVVEYYEKVFDPENLVISINGNVDSQKAAEDFNNIFQSVSPAAGQPVNYTDYSSKIPPLTAPKTVVREIKDLKTDWIIIGWQVPGLLNKKDYAALDVIDAILGSGMSSRLFRNLRVKDGLAYQLGSQYNPNVIKGAFIVYIGTNPENLEKAKSKLFEEVYRFKKEFVGTKELQDAKDKLIGQYILSQETNLEKASTIGWFEASGRGRDFGKEYEQLINSVTVSDIVEAANKYFNGNYVLSIVKNK